MRGGVEFKECFQRVHLGRQRVVDAEVVGMFEQFETRDGVKKEDHNILARLKDEDFEINDEIKNILKDFVLHAWDHRVGKKVEIGNFYGKEEAESFVDKLRT